ncbi:MAG: hypothetical protein L6R42_006842, partial [Xanthoria sp. 1 TBL-2021]
AQQCQDYWKGTAPICKPTDDCDSTHRYNGVQDVRGDGARCFTGKKKLCQCIAPGGGPGCIPVLPPRTFTTMKGIPCEEAPEQLHCQQPDPEPPLPTNDISSKPLTQDDVLSYFKQTETGALTELVAALGQDTAGKSKEELVDAAYTQFTSTMTTLDIEKVDPKTSFESFEQGPAAWTYFDGRTVAQT